MLARVKNWIPPLNGLSHKGQSGRIGIVGGSQAFTGSPFFAAMASLRTGSDLAYILCTPEASTPLKSYSPELIVMPELLDVSAMRHDRIEFVLSRLHCIVIGPGLSRDPQILACARSILLRAISLKLCIVLDADGLALIEQDPDILHGCHNAVITPNLMEVKRLEKSLNVSGCQAISDRIGAVVLEKGRNDAVYTSQETLICDSPAGLKRCGGQGDILCGILSTILAWSRDAIDDRMANTAACAYAASHLMRTSSHRAFQQHGRSLITTDIISEIGKAFADIFDSSTNNC